MMRFYAALVVMVTVDNTSTIYVWPQGEEVVPSLSHGEVIGMYPLVYQGYIKNKRENNELHDLKSDAIRHTYHLFLLPGRHW